MQTARFVLIAEAAIMAALLWPLAPGARADLVTLDSCSLQPLSRPFAPWVDYASYEMVAGGDFESGQGAWDLDGGARIVSGSESYASTGTLGSHSLELPAGASATSPTICVDAAHPSARLFVQGSGLVAATVIYDGLSIPAGVTLGDHTWEPTPPLVTSSAVPATLSGGTFEIQVQFTSLLGTVHLDDTWLDPWSRG